MRYLNIKKALEAWQALQPLSEKDRNRLSRRFTVDFNYNSNHIEGNTLTYGQTEILLLFGKVIGEANVQDVQEMTASNLGLRMMTEEAAMKEMPLTQNFIRTLHKTLLREDYYFGSRFKVQGSRGSRWETGYTVHAGTYKTRPNSVITRYGDRFEYASPEETPGLMTDLVDWYNAAEWEGRLSPVELAALFHYRYIRIHPFEDGNGRIARLMVNFILSRHDYPMIVVRSRKDTVPHPQLHEDTQRHAHPAHADPGRHARGDGHQHSRHPETARPTDGKEIRGACRQRRRLAGVCDAIKSRIQVSGFRFEGFERLGYEIENLGSF